VPALLDPDGAIAADYDIEGFPSEVFIDGEGVIVRTQLGGLTAEELWAIAEEITPAPTTTTGATSSSIIPSSTTVYPTSTSSVPSTSGAATTTSVPTTSTSTVTADPGGGDGFGGERGDTGREGLSGIMIGLIAALVLVIAVAAVLLIASRRRTRPAPVPSPREPERTGGDDEAGPQPPQGPQAPDRV